MTRKRQRIEYRSLPHSYGGGWGVRGPVDQIVKGAQLKVIRKNGTTSIETIHEVLYNSRGLAVARILGTWSVAENPEAPLQHRIETVENELEVALFERDFAADRVLAAQKRLRTLRTGIASDEEE
jgi:hypothetical protein